ncbi:MAG: hypothetical protein R2792_03585 [Saprospiraceae bacterium]
MRITACTASVYITELKPPVMVYKPAISAKSNNDLKQGQIREKIRLITSPPAYSVAAISARMFG